jgi:hypothetical protein
MFGPEDDKADIETGDQEVSVSAGIGDDKVEPSTQSDEKQERKELEREGGKSLLPFSRVQKIIKADKVRLLSRLVGPLPFFDHPIGHPSRSKGSDPVDINCDGGGYQKNK